MDSSPPDLHYRDEFRTPWDDLETNLFLEPRLLRGKPIPKLRLDSCLSTYLSILPIGNSYHVSYWQDHWDKCYGASYYRRLLHPMLQFEIAGAEKVSEALMNCLADRARRSAVDRLEEKTRLTIQSQKRPRDFDEDTVIGGSPAKRQRVSDTHPPSSSRTWIAEKDESAPSSEQSSAPFNYAAYNAEIALEIQHIHDQMIGIIQYVLHLVEQAENIESQLHVHYVEELATSWDFGSSASFDHLAEQLAQIQEQVRKFCLALDKLASELKGWTARGNLYSSKFTRWDHYYQAEHEKYWLTLEKGVVKYWVERGQQAIEVWEDT